MSALSADEATASTTFQSRLQQRRDGTWKTPKKSPNETVSLQLVRDGGSWPVPVAG
jgi:hypothetical protein